MKRIDAAALADLAGLANLAPSVHNTQPARWALDDEGRILLVADLSRQLQIGDPSGRDLGLSCGAALEGMVMALAARGTGTVVEDLWNDNILSWRHGYRLVARLIPDGEAIVPQLGDWIEKRFTWRGPFAPASPETVAAVERWAAEAGDVTHACGHDDLSFLATLNDQASLSIMRDRAFRDELVAWMRLSPAHPAYRFDGLNLEVLRMGPFEGAVAGRVLGSPLFALADRIGLAKTLVTEAAKTMTATACLFFHRPAQETPVASGRAFYRFWLGFTRFGLAAWPMAALADTDRTADILTKRFMFPADHRLINVLRVGPAPSTLPKFRLPPAELVVSLKPD